MCMLISLFIGWNVVTYCVVMNPPPPQPPKVIVVPVPQKPANVLYDSDLILKEV